jgi:hypothetical protein
MKKAVQFEVICGRTFEVLEEQESWIEVEMY